MKYMHCKTVDTASTCAFWHYVEAQQTCYFAESLKSLLPWTLCNTAVDCHMQSMKLTTNSFLWQIFPWQFPDRCHISKFYMLSRKVFTRVTEYQWLKWAGAHWNWVLGPCRTANETSEAKTKEIPAEMDTSPCTFSIAIFGCALYSFNFNCGPNVYLYFQHQCMQCLDQWRLGLVTSLVASTKLLDAEPG